MSCSSISPVYLIEKRIKAEQKVRKGKTIKGKYKNKKDSAKMLYELGKTLKG